MARLQDREKAIELRKQQLSYSQIKERLGVSKSTLSVWLKDLPLSREQINNLRANSEKRIEKFRQTMRVKRDERLSRVYSVQKDSLLPLSKKEVYIAGLFLYLGEGSKTRNQTCLSNTNPKTIHFFLYWLTKICDIPQKKIKIRLHLYSDMDQENEITYWMNFLNLPKKHFLVPYIKQGNQERINYHGGFGHGTCNLIASGVPLFEKIMMGIKVIHDTTQNSFQDIK